MFKIYEERTLICIKCEEYDSKKMRCNKCHCYMPIKAMVPFADCPLDKWKPVDVESTE